MIEINLLPWREDKRQENKKRIILEFSAAIFVVIIAIIFIHFSFSNAIKEQKIKSQALQNKLQIINTNIRDLNKFPKIRDLLKQQVETLHSIQYARYQTVTLIKEITQRTPKGIYLSEMERKNDLVTLKGTASSLHPVTEIIKKMNESNEIINPVLAHVTTTTNKDGTKITEFEISIKLKPFNPAATQAS